MSDLTKLVEDAGGECHHLEIVPIDGDEDWGRCTKCGDEGFPLTNEAAGLPPGPMHWETTVHVHQDEDDIVFLQFMLPFKPPTCINKKTVIQFNVPDGVAWLAEHHVEPTRVLDIDPETDMVVGFKKE